jgi:hypothetical protein
MKAATREAAQAMLEAYEAACPTPRSPWGGKPSEYAAGRAIMAADPETQVAVVRAAVLRLVESPPSQGWQRTHTLLSNLTRRHLPYAPEDARAVFRAIASQSNYYQLPVLALVRSLARSLAEPGAIDACRSELEAARATVGRWFPSADQRKALRMLDDLLAGQTESPVVRSDEWGDQVLPLLAAMDAATRERWIALLRHCGAAKGSAPTAKWVTATRPLIGAIGEATFAQLAMTWVGALRTSGNKPPTYDREMPQLTHNGCLLVPENADLLRGLAWACAGVGSAGLATALADAAIATYRKIPGIGPRSAKVAGACVHALKSMPGLDGAAQLDRVRLGVKQPTYRATIERAMDEAATRAGMSRDDLEELTVPTFDLTDGRRTVAFGQAMAELRVDGLEVAIAWRDAAGKPRKAEPAEVRREHPAELKELKRLRDDIAHMLVAQRERIERLPLLERAWSLADWRARYLNHPLIGGLARRLIWRFTDGERSVDGAWRDGRIVDSADQALDLSATARVSLWHPVFAAASDVLAWRTWLERHEVSQPFKQAHREVYLLTDAERATQTYSNRFAGHILRQHQFNALAASRGWRNKLRLMVDDAYPPATLDLPHWHLRAEYWVEGAGDNYDTDTNATGTYLYLTTDQVRFYRTGSRQNIAHASGGGYYRPRYFGGRGAPVEDDALPLEVIPPIVFSEVLRDVDLFVGVASVGNDPTWQDGGPVGRYRDYWHSYSFGELSLTAETRKQLLFRLIPRLAIADRCAIEGRFLRVRGDLRTYRIHLGSGNILMEPNDQYLCIVPSRGRAESPTEHLYLPFEGDALLSIILSKAFLLAEDTKITDASITRQLAMR